jgi:hypothetical protein
LTGRERSQHDAPDERARRKTRWRVFLVFGGLALALLAVGAGEFLRPAPTPATSGGKLKDTAVGADAKTSAAKLAAFYAALAALDDGRATGPVTILHLGDSHIAADGIAGELRRLLQARFGDAGRGMMMPGFPFPGYRAIGFTFGKRGSWTASDSVQEAGAYGLTGVSVTGEAAGAELELTSDSKPFASAEVSLLTGPRRGEARISAGGWSKVVSTAADARSVLRVAVPVQAASLTVAVVGNGPVTVLGWSVSTDRPGIRYVNLGIPGASVYTSMRFDDEIAKSDLRAIAPKLVMLGYGTNAGFLDNLNIAIHRHQYDRLFALVRAGAPGASLLMLGPPAAAKLPAFARAAGEDRACRPLSEQEMADYPALMARKDASLGRWHEPPNLVRLRRPLREIAGRQGAVYFDLSRFMGGPCSIDRWTKLDPPLALPDHIHLTADGSNRVARALYEALMAGYDKFRATDALATKQ